MERTATGGELYRYGGGDTRLWETSANVNAAAGEQGAVRVAYLGGYRWWQLCDVLGREPQMAEQNQLTFLPVRNTKLTDDYMA